MKRWYDPNVVRFPIVLVLVLLAVGAIALAARSPTGLYEAETIYEGALTVAVDYRHACVGYTDATGVVHAAVLPSTCRANVINIQQAVSVTDPIYQRVKGNENSIPVGLSAQFINAAGILQTALTAAGAYGVSATMH